MYKATGSIYISTDTPHFVFHKMDTWQGQSGSGLWRVVNGQHYVFGVHSGDHSNAFNRGTRITSSKFQAIQTFIAGNK